jgi:hypothetical protein
VSDPWKPAEWEDADAHAIKALSRGDADEIQQKRALDWIITKAARTYDMSYHPEKPGDTAFAEGSRFVGLQIVKLVNITLSRKGEPTEQG